MSATPSTEPIRHPGAIVIGGGPAGLMAAEMLAAQGVPVDVYDAMPSVGRKFLMAGKGGMNITHSEPADAFLGRYGARADRIGPLLDTFDAASLRAWVHALGIDTFVGSSGRVFPTDMKAAPLLRAWLHRLREGGMRLHVRHRWIGFGQSEGWHVLRFATRRGDEPVEIEVAARAVVLALGGGSWARLGSDGAWLPMLAARGVDVAPLRPANCGFDIEWSDVFRTQHAGEPVKSVAIGVTTADGTALHRQGEFVISESGIEGSLVYALSAPIRDLIDAQGFATITLDLAPGRTAEDVAAEVGRPRGSRSVSSHLQSRLGITGVKARLLREVLSKEAMHDPAALAAAIKALPLRLVRARPIDEVISTAGGVRFEAMNDQLMLNALPGVFCAGEMLDWEAPTGGYLLTACFASGRVAGAGAAAYVNQAG
ncbi:MULTISPECIES: TIGR03862 family flavoprotein [unclassified Cupriavidus]|uniref:TIGR03862 family flavoprotein n=1 Tax=unclassified Cupriavidus TaxID=2640874 RepID=UPI001C000E22|nr:MULTISPECIES: TIGR03862 family flavoprotein [unclassified Cupriavidus]MCA3188210.1 TIGR03862 family flavoprotein [Cupriavidus sp.]MCA3192025.1 TIGR03862 family flavoprotein [Cupriavidus sp.]MCA3197770.1 TIGR03862 family flavoprotein [Cupriavidus sp.]MCA3202822.1 TIGR03862 family flavoprotein [Cupriavidus sp.]MCA3207726.1 TIGR03862 family flavoprotein [Cupriavidus sp.]